MTDTPQQYVPPVPPPAAPPPSIVATGATTTPATINVTPNAPPTDALPDEFNPFEHLVKMYLPQHNAAVALFFKDLGTDWKPNIATARSSLRVACTMVDGENELMCAMRHRLFFDLLGYGRSQLMVYNGSTNDVAPPVAGHPKVYFYFSQDIASVPTGGTRVDAEYSFRLMTETGATITQTKLTTLATTIKSLFISNGQGIVFAKGKNIYKYSDPVHGYRLMIYANASTDALPIIENMLQCQEVTYNVNNFSTHEPQQSNTATPAQVLNYGVEVTPPQFRPSANVRFRYSYVEIPLVKKPVYLVDTTGRHNALVN